MFIQFVSEKLSKHERSESRSQRRQRRTACWERRWCALVTNEQQANERWRRCSRWWRYFSTLAYFGDKCCQLWMDERRLIVRLVSWLLHWHNSLTDTQQGAGRQRWCCVRRDTTRQTKPNRANATAQLTAACVCPRNRKKVKDKKTQNETNNRTSRCWLLWVLLVLVMVPMTSWCTLALAQQNWVN